MEYYKAKKDLEGFDSKDIEVLSRYYNIPQVADHNDSLWLIAISIISSAKTGKAQMPPSPARLTIEGSEPSGRKPRYTIVSHTPPPIRHLKRPPTPPNTRVSKSMRPLFVPRGEKPKPLFPSPSPEPSPSPPPEPSIIKPIPLRAKPPTPPPVYSPPPGLPKPRPRRIRPREPPLPQPPLP